MSLEDDIRSIVREETQTLREDIESLEDRLDHLGEDGLPGEEDIRSIVLDAFNERVASRARMDLVRAEGPHALADSGTDEDESTPSTSPSDQSAPLTDSERRAFADKHTNNQAEIAFRMMAFIQIWSEISEGNSFPTYNQIEGSLDVSSPQVRRAYRQLENEGWIDREGEGSGPKTRPVIFHRRLENPDEIVDRSEVLDQMDLT